MDNSLKLLVSCLLFFTKGMVYINISSIADSNSTIECNSVQVLKILNLTTTRREMKCETPPNHGFISKKTIKHVQELCDRKKQCTIDRNLIIDREHFLKERGYFGRSYDCRYNQVEECNFDDGSNWCRFSRKGEEKKFVWRRKPKFNFLPSDHTHQNTASKGHFAYVLNKNDASPNATAKLTVDISNMFIEDKCLIFWYVITDTKHNLEVQFNDNTIETLSGVQKTWTEKMIPMSGRFNNITFSVPRNGRRFNGRIVLDDFRIIDVACNYLKPQGDVCIPLNNKNVTKTCDTPENVTITFDPSVTECAELYSSIQESCGAMPNASQCAPSLDDSVLATPECFWKDDVFVEFTCIDIVDSSLDPERRTPKISLGIFGVIASVICIAMSVGAFTIIRSGKRKHTTVGQLQDDYVGHQTIALTNYHSNHGFYQYGSDSNDEESVRTNAYSDYGYATSEREQFRTNDEYAPSCQHDPQNIARKAENQHLLNNDDNVGKVNFLLEKPSKRHEMCHEDDNDIIYDLSDTEYAISVQNCHVQNEEEVCDHSINDTCDSTLHTSRISYGEDQYDHFNEQNTVDGFDITRT